MTRPVRVLQLGSPSGLYGAERWILALVRHLDRRTVESTVAVIQDGPSSEPAPLCEQARALGLATHTIEAPGKVNLSAVRLLRRYIDANEIQILHSHFYKTDIIGLLATRGTSCRCVTTPHGWSTDAGLALRFYEALDRAIFPFFDAVIPLSENLHSGLVRRLGMHRNLQLITNGVDIGEIDDVHSVSPELCDWRSNGAFVVGYIGQLIPRKGLRSLLEAFASIDTPNKRLALVGEGAHRAELETLASELGISAKTRFFGYRADRIELLRGFDVFVLPSQLEGIPRCLMESMAAGVPVIASDIPGNRDLIVDGVTGLTFPVGNCAALRRQLERISDLQARTVLARAGRELVVERYSAAAMARKYQDLYARLVA